MDALMREIRRYGGRLTALIGDAKLEIEPNLVKTLVAAAASDYAPVLLLLESQRGGATELRGYYVYRRGRRIVADRVPIEELIVMELYRRGRVSKPRHGRKYCAGSKCLSWREIRPEDVEIYINYLRDFVA